MDINALLRNVNNTTNKGTNAAEANTRQQTNAAQNNASASVATGQQGEKVTLTNTASRLGQLTQAQSGKPEVNAERVASLRAAIADGSYPVNPRSIATRLMSFEQLLKA